MTTSLLLLGATDVDDDEMEAVELEVDAVEVEVGVLDDLEIDALSRAIFSSRSAMYLVALGVIPVRLTVVTSTGSSGLLDSNFRIITVATSLIRAAHSTSVIVLKIGHPLLVVSELFMCWMLIRCQNF